MVRALMYKRTTMKRALPSSPRTRRQRPAPAEPLPRREAILDAALAVIAAHGTEKVTHRSVAAAAGVPLGSTTYYFASRDELVREAFRRYVMRVMALFAELARETEPTTPAALVDLLVEIARREVDGRWTVIVEYELVLRAARDPALATDFRRYEQTMISQLAEALERLGAAQPFDGARTLIALVRGFELDGLTRAEADVADMKRRLIPVVDLVLRRAHPGAKEKS
jgi:TetR/AcrR family transcriptional regulator, regulator of biofilm formation and stress response